MKLGYVVNMSEMEPFLLNLSTVSTAESSAWGALALKLTDSHFSFPGVLHQVEGFMVQSRGTHDLQCQRVLDTFFLRE